MAPIDEGSTIITEPIKVEAESVDRELANLWKMAVDGRIPGTAAPVTRAILSNLVVYAASKVEADKAAGAVVELIADHPARVIIVDAESGKQESKLDADVSMLCNITEHGRRLCGEEIRFHTHGVASTALGTILPVLVPDLPIYLWTPGDLVWDKEFLGNLTRISDHWIIDSRQFANCRNEFQLAVSLGPDHKPPIALHDLAWTSLSQWRSLTAQYFDPQPTREYLRGVYDITIACGLSSDNKPNIESLMLAAWLISRLGWQASQISKTTDGTLVINAGFNEHEAQIHLTLKAEAKLPIEGVVIESDLNGKHGTFSSTIAERLDEVIIRVDAADIPNIHRTIRLIPESLSREVRQVMDSTSRDTLYEQALPIVQELIAQIEAIG